jgi:hypothetical protein
MGLRFPRRGKGDQESAPDGGQAPPDAAGRPQPPPDAAQPIPDRSCCCPGKPTVKVVMPVTSALPRPVDLWLCGHHYRTSRQALDAAGATTFMVTLPSVPAQADHKTAAAPDTTAA